MSQPVVDAAYKIIRANRYLTLATCLDGLPWAAPLAYVLDCDLRFYWYSAVESRHSHHIAGNPAVAAAIFDSTLPSDAVDGVQLSGLAEPLDGPGMEAVFDLYWTQSFPDSADRARWIRPKETFLGEGPLRFYRLTPKSVFKLDLDTTKVDRRIEVDLNELQRVHRMTV